MINGVEPVKDDVLEAETLEIERSEKSAQTAPEKPRTLKVRIRCSFDAINFKPGFEIEDGFSDGKPYVETYKGKFFVDEDVWIVTNPDGEKDVYSSEEFHQTYISDLL